jgi:hypothetical protein
MGALLVTFTALACAPMIAMDPNKDHPQDSDSGDAVGADAAKKEASSSVSDADVDAGPAEDATVSDAGDASEARDARAAACLMGYHDCAGVCASNFSPNSCGASSCVPCAVPIGGVSVQCNGVSCLGFCGAPLTLCDAGSGRGACVDTASDPNHCGKCANACPALDGGSAPSCVNGGCQ